MYMLYHSITWISAVAINKNSCGDEHEHLHVAGYSGMPHACKYDY